MCKKFFSEQFKAAKLKQNNNEINKIKIKLKIKKIIIKIKIKIKINEKSILKNKNKFQK